MIAQNVFFSILAILMIVSALKVVTTKNTIMDSMPAKPKKNPLSKRVTDKGEVYTLFMSLYRKYFKRRF